MKITTTTFLFLFCLSIYANQQKYYQVPNLGSKTWEPSTNQVQQTLSSVEHYCKFRLSDTFKKMRNLRIEAEVEMIESNGTFVISYDAPLIDTNSIPKEFKVYNIPYPQFEKRVCPFVEDRGNTQELFIAVQHLITSETQKRVEGSRPFTVYYLVRTGDTGLDTRTGYPEGTAVAIKYSPGPPYYISTAAF